MATKRKLTDFTPDNRNANKGSVRGLAMLEDSLRKYGAGRSILVDKHNRIIAGNKTAETAVDIGLTDAIVVPTDGKQLVVVQRVDVDLDTPQGRELAIADNRTGEVSLAWDADVLQALAGEGVDLAPFFDDDELAALLADVAGEPPVDPGAQVDKAEELQAKWQVATGDLWTVGNHRLLCGDSTRREDVQRVMGGEKAIVMFADPPYGVEYDAEWRGEAGHATLGHNRVGKVQADDKADWTPAWKLSEAQVAYIWHASAFADVVMQSLRQAGYDVRQQIIWAKTLPIMSRAAYHWQHEPCWYAVKHGCDAHWVGDRTQTTLWTEPPPNHIMSNSTDDKTAHPTQKPVALAIRAIQNHTNINDVVYDPFIGSGTTLVACEQTGRKGRGIEIEPKYVSVALERLSQMGLSPVRVETR